MAYGDTEPVGTGIRSQPTTGSKRFSKGKAKPKAKESRTARYRRLSGDPRTRAAVPSQYLSSEHRREREMNARLNAPVGAGSSVTNRDVAREARADANVRYGQSEAELRNQYARSVMQQQRLPQYMDAYRAQLNQAKTQAQQAYAQAAQNARGLAGAVSNTAGDAQMVQQMQAEAAQRGGAVDPNALNTAVQAAAVRQAGGNSLGALADVQGANTGVMYDRDIATTGLRLIEELTREAGEQNRVNRSKVQLLGEKGEYEAGQRSKIRERERAAGLENLVFAADQQKAQTDAALKDADRRSDAYDRVQDRKLAREREARQSAADRRAAQKDRYQRENKLGPYKPPSSKTGNGKDEFGNTTKDRRRAQDAFSAAKNIAGQLGGSDWKATADFLISKKKINPVYARAAAQQSVLGYVGPETEKELRRRGVSKGFKRGQKKTGSGVKQAGSGYGGFG